ncbi:MAG: hypothetical protein VR67_02525 [Peptococcaceae bacterium BRH_c8a]|nr:MAG: hypothetical protein VR67_02525 [Peptococcaceae bacterium BRH_c8a]
MSRGNGSGAGMGRQMRGNGYGCGLTSNTGVVCRANPSLPRRWWATSSSAVPVASAYTAAAPSDSEYLQEQARFLKTQLEEIEKRLAHLEKKEPEKKE